MRLLRKATNPLLGRRKNEKHFKPKTKSTFNHPGRTSPAHHAHHAVAGGDAQEEASEAPHEAPDPAEQHLD